MLAEMCFLNKFETVEDEIKRRDLVRKQFDCVSQKLKAAKSVLRVKFLETCVASKLIPRFLQKFKFPKIEAYDLAKIEKFQGQILKDELVKARTDAAKKETLSKETCEILWKEVPPEISKVEINYRINIKVNSEMDKLKLIHQRKLTHLSEQQEKPLWGLNEKAYT